VDPPAGVEIREGMNYNPYFPGGAISMARVLFDGLVEYDDGERACSGRSSLIQVFRRHPRHDVTDGQGRRHVSELGCRARAR
jgi:hypothetical protein